MQNKHLVILSFAGATLITVASLAAYSIYLQPNQLFPTTSGTQTPIVSYDSPNNSTRPTLTDEERKKADAPGDKTPTSQSTAPEAPVSQPAHTSNAPKQDRIRADVTDERLYYPLVAPNDPGYGSSWALQRVNAPAAWSISTGNNNTVVAVIDTGFAMNHEDLKDSWYINSGESGLTSIGGRCWTGTAVDKKANNCDDDNNGYIDDYRGWNFYLQDNNPQAGRSNPNGAGVAHGTETAGLVGAGGNNSKGIATINWGTKIMPLQALSDDGPGYTSDVAAAIYYAVDNGASVVSMSLGGLTFDPWIKEAVDYAYANGIPVIAAAGNCGTGNEGGCESVPAGTMSYPALYDHVIAVGASDTSNTRASFSSYGPRLDIVAPGSGTIVSPTWTPANDTSLYSGALYGTSFAAPQVASLVSLVKAIRPSSTVEDIRALIMATASKPAGMGGVVFTNEYGHGIIDANKALTVAVSLNTTTATPELLQAGGSTSEHSFKSGESLGSGCTSQTGSYCTVRARNSATGTERFLPYQQLTGSSAGWTWPTTILGGNGSWVMQAYQGDRASGVYELFNK
jgi:subtilisin family serine protease